jgi:hypothetical protein
VQDDETTFYIGFEILAGFHGSKNSMFAPKTRDASCPADRR